MMDKQRQQNFKTLERKVKFSAPTEAAILGVSLGIVNAIRSNPLHFTRVRESTLCAWIAEEYAQVGVRIAAKDVFEYATPNTFPATDIDESYLVHKSDR